MYTLKCRKAGQSNTAIVVKHPCAYLTMEVCRPAWQQEKQCKRSCPTSKLGVFSPEKITLTAPHLLSYLPFTIYRGMKLRNCVHRMISETTFHACHIPLAFFSLFVAYSSVFRFNLSGSKLVRCALLLLFAIQVLRNGHQREANLYAKKLRSSTCVRS